MSQSTARHALPFIQPAQAQKHVTHNEALERLDLLVQLTVEAFGANTPPAQPGDGQIWAIGPAPAGAWAGQGGHLAAWVNGAWLFLTPLPGWRAAQGTDLRIWSGSDWRIPDLPLLQNIEGLGVQTSFDATNRLAVASEATLLTHDGAGHQLKINKNDATDTASLLFQTGWSGRAEMGLAGSDAWSIKVSADGSTWHEALIANPTTGQITLPEGLSVSGPLSLPQDSLDLGSAAFAGQVPLTRGGTGATTAAGARSALGLGNAATADVTSSATDTTPGRVPVNRPQGIFGWGATSGPPDCPDFNDNTLPAGLYRTINTTPNIADRPSPGSQFGYLLALKYDLTQMRQIWAAVNFDQLWHRRHDGVAWQPWRRLYDSSNILGTVSQSGGVPAGAIIQRGSNANGEFVRFADGTQICWRSMNAGSAIDQTWTFPAAFSEVPIISRPLKKVLEKQYSSTSSMPDANVFHQFDEST